MEETFYSVLLIVTRQSRTHLFRMSQEVFSETTGRMNHSIIFRPEEIHQSGYVFIFDFSLATCDANQLVTKLRYILV